MAETVKKSRIVSDENLESSLLEEFDLRLKNCMQDDVEQEEFVDEVDDYSHHHRHQVEQSSQIYENIKVLNGGTTKPTSQNGHWENGYHQQGLGATSVTMTSTTLSTATNGDRQTKVNVEQSDCLQSTTTTTKEEEEEEERTFQREQRQNVVTVVDEEVDTTAVTDRNIYEDVQGTIVLTSSSSSSATTTTTTMIQSTETTTSSSVETDDVKSVKDRMFLSTGEGGLLFTQTVMSPMLTPSDENYEFLQGVSQNTLTDPDSSSPPSDPIDEKSVDKRRYGRFDVKQETARFIENEKYDILKLVDAKSTVVDVIYENVQQRRRDDVDEVIYENLQHQRDEGLYANVSETYNDESTTSEPPGQEEEDVQVDVVETTDATVEKDVGAAATKKTQETVRIVDETNDAVAESDVGLKTTKTKENVRAVDESTDVVVESDVGLKTTKTNENVRTVDESTNVVVESDVGLKTKENVRTVDESTNVTVETDVGLKTKKTKENVRTVDESINVMVETDVGSKTKENVRTVDESTNAMVESDVGLKTKKTKENVRTVDESTNVMVESDVGLKTTKIKESTTNSVAESDVGLKTKKTKETVRIVDETLTTVVVKDEVPAPSSPPPPKEDTSTYKTYMPKCIDVMRQINKFENVAATTKHEESDSNVCNNTTNSNYAVSNESSSETTFVETTTESKTQDKVLKKKKSKKSKKEHEKENISVNDTTNNIDRNEDSYYNVSVKNLCRSFSDLTRIDEDKQFDKNNRPQYVKSSFSKFDALQKKTVLHVRSSDAGKAQEKFNGSAVAETTTNCKSCTKPVFVMEQIKAERNIWHKNCFRCTACNKQLTVDTYESNEGTLYCKPHFKALFAPKAVEDDAPASDKPDLGLEELQSLNVKQRFQVFENHDNDSSLERTPSAVNVKRSPSILSKLARFQAKGMDIGVADDSLNGIPIEESSSEESVDEEELNGDDPLLVRARRQQREKPFHFDKMSDVKSKWEQGDQQCKEERREERKQEIQTIRSRLFMGKQGKMKEAYQQAVAESESGVNVKRGSANEQKMDTQTKSIMERFEKGEVVEGDKSQQQKDNEDMSMFESGISKKSRSIFLELDANASKAPQMAPVSPPKPSGDIRKVYLERQQSENVVKSTDQVDDIVIETADISNRFKFFETYKEPEQKRKAFRITPPRDGQAKNTTPDREIYRDPEIVRAEEQAEDSEVAKQSHTATKMLSMFRQMEQNKSKDSVTAGPKPLKRFTPPPEPARHETSSGEDDSGSEEESDAGSENVLDNNRMQDGDLIEAQKAARAKQLRAKFERWEANELQREQSSVNIAEELGEDQSQIESAKSLRARFESMRESNTDKERAPRVKVNRFVDTTNNVETCKSCNGRVYPLEKTSVHGSVYHKNCFRCRECHTVLRMDSYTYNQGLLYCIPHFKRLFIAKGNYETGFGLDQHKEKWNTTIG